MAYNTKFQLIHDEENGDYYLGTDKPDRFDGKDASEIVYSLRGDDLLLGRGGNDELYAGYGADQADGGPGNDWVDGSYGNDKIYGGSGVTDLLHGGPGNDQSWGNGGTDVFYGDAGDDRYDGGTGNDNVIAGPGNDRAMLGAGADILSVETTTEPDSGQGIGRETIADFNDGADHLEMVLYGIRNGFNAAIFADDFLDSNDDGMINAKDKEVDVSQGDLVLDLQAVLERAFGPSDYAGEQKVVLQDITSIDADTVRPPEGVNTSDWLHEDDITIA